MGLKMELNRQVVFAGIFVAVIALAPWPIGFYTFSRIVLCGCSAYVAYYLSKKNKNLWLLGAALAVLYNPVVPVYLDSKGLWSIVNIGTAVFFFFALSSASGNADEKSSEGLE